MIIEIDNQSGFCYGVIQTVKLAEELLQKNETVYCLGEIVHNEEEVARLKALGMKTISHNDLENLENATVLIRAHGETPDTYQKITYNNNLLNDGTCPIVLKLQQKVKKAFSEFEKDNGQIVIFGKKNHAEVIGLEGQIKNHAIVISKLDEIEQLDFSKPIALFSQTTQTPADYEMLSSEIRKRMEIHFPNENIPLKITNSICGHVSKRGEHLADFAKKHQTIIFVSGTKSSNGKVLADVCKKNNEQTHTVSGISDLKKEWFENIETVGICGATSTPMWLMEDIAQKIKTL